MYAPQLVSMMPSHFLLHRGLATSATSLLKTSSGYCLVSTCKKRFFDSPNETQFLRQHLRLINTPQSLKTALIKPIDAAEQRRRRSHTMFTVSEYIARLG